MKKIQKNKHNKKRNTAFLYEILIAEIAKASMAGKEEKRERIVSLLKEFFSKGKPLYSELTIYNSLKETKCRDYNVASRFLTEIKKDYAFVLSNEDVYGQQSKLIKTINKEDSGIFNNFVPNYKSLASIYQIFNTKMSSKSRVIFEEKYIEGLCKLNEDNSEMKQLDTLTYKFFLEKFNEQYGNSLLESQKKTLTYYVMSFTDNSLTLKSFLNEEVGRLKEVISESKEILEDEKMKEKSEQIVEFLDSFKKQKISEHMLQRVLQIQSLADDILTGE